MHLPPPRIQCRFYTRGTRPGRGRCGQCKLLLWPHQPGGMEQCPARWCSVNAGLQDGQMREGIGLPTGRRLDFRIHPGGAGGNTGLPWAVAAPAGTPPGQVQPPHQSLASRVRRPRTQVLPLPLPTASASVSRGTLTGQLPGRVGEGPQRAQQSQAVCSSRVGGASQRTPWPAMSGDRSLERGVPEPGQRGGAARQLLAWAAPIRLDGPQGQLCL